MNYNSSYFNVKQEPMEQSISKDLPMQALQGLLSLGKDPLASEPILNSQKEVFNRTPITALKRTPVMQVPNANVTEGNLMFKEPGMIWGKSPSVYEKAPHLSSWPWSSLQTSCDTLTGLPEWPQCFPDPENGKQKFFGTMDRLEVAKVVLLAKKLQMRIGKWDQRNGGMDMTSMKTSLLTTIAETSVRLQSCLDSLTGTLCEWSSKEGLVVLLPSEFLSQHPDALDLLGKAELKRTSDSWSEESSTCEDLMDSHWKWQRTDQLSKGFFLEKQEPIESCDWDLSPEAFNAAMNGEDIVVSQEELDRWNALCDESM